MLFPELVFDLAVKNLVKYFDIISEAFRWSSLTPANREYVGNSSFNILSNIVDLRMDDYKFEGDVSNSVKAASVKLTLKNDKSFLLDVYKAEEDEISEFIADVDFNNYLYYINENDVKRFIKTQEELVEKESK